MNETVFYREAFEKLAEADRWEVWRDRQERLWASFIKNPREWKVVPTVGCAMCIGWEYQVAAHSWPSAFECVCGTKLIVDRSLPDKAERLTMMSDSALATYANFLFKQTKMKSERPKLSL